ncbi:portal protein [Mycobacterium phage MalagasyRose]|uniref:Portal protein n=1 Tax=Mycobacterium phage MalagasyRose TaxID=2599870 RepID=A0A5J6TEK7_9CAUD|nr:portal protein [Mycobacterium phage MalagasyRose]QFG08858.1 portal protein [Mycobacterium phage MalagasyRose]
MLSRKSAIDMVRHILAGPRPYELERCNRIADALRPWTEANAHQMLRRKGAPIQAIEGLAWASQTNYLPLVVDVYSQAMKVDNYIASSTRKTATPWVWWQRNKMAAQQTGIIRSVLKYGAGYAIALPSLAPPGAEQPSPGVAIRAASPRQLTALYGEPIAWTPGVTPVDDDWPMVALETRGKAMRLIDEEGVHFIGARFVPESALGWKDPMYSNVDNFEYIEARAHNVGVCPVVRFRDHWILDDDEVMGVVEPLIQIQSRIDETVYESLVSQYFTAFTQRWVAGWKPKNDQEALRQAASDTWYFDQKDVKVGQFEQGKPDGYIAMGEAAKRDLSAIGQVPAHQLGMQGLVNISEATLAALENGKEQRAGEMEVSLGESFEQLLRTCGHITGDEEAARDFDAEAKWQDKSARNFAAQIDALGKMFTMLNLPEELLWEDVPGKSKEWVDRAKKLADERREQMLRMPKPAPTEGEFDDADPAVAAAGGE